MYPVVASTKDLSYELILRVIFKGSTNETVKIEGLMGPNEPVTGSSYSNE